jgi:hypothetical protein
MITEVIDEGSLVDSLFPPDSAKAMRIHFPIFGSRDHRCGETTLRFSPPASGILANGRGRPALIGDDLIPLAGIQSIGTG